LVLQQQLVRFDYGMDCAWGYFGVVVVDASRHFGFDSLDSLDHISYRDDAAGSVAADSAASAVAVAKPSEGMHQQGTG
jgi:hypothetical protein